MSQERSSHPAPKRPYEIYGLTEQERLHWRLTVPFLNSPDKMGDKIRDTLGQKQQRSRRNHGKESICRKQDSQYTPQDPASIHSRRKDLHCDGRLQRESTIAELCRREGINQNLYYRWSKEFLEAGKERLNGNTQRQADSGEVKALRQENEQLKQLVAELALKNKVMKKSLTGLENLWDE